MTTYPNTNIQFPVGSEILPLTDVKLGERARTDYGEIEDFANNIVDYGLIQPVVINQENRVVAGGRRFTAHHWIANNRPEVGLAHIAVVRREALDEASLKQLELYENDQRLNFSWQEKCLLINDIHHERCKRDALGELNEQELATLEMSGRKVWGQAETAALMSEGKTKVSRTTVTNALVVATELRKGNEEILNATSMRDALRIIAKHREDALEKVRVARLSAAQQQNPAPPDTPAPAAPATSMSGPISILEDEAMPDSDNIVVMNDQKRHIDLTNFHLGKWEDIMPDIPMSTISHIITDPPYAIDVKEMGTRVNESLEESHKPADNMEMLKMWFHEAHRVLVTDAWCLLWCDPWNFRELADLAVYAGFSVQRWPMIWRKTSKCRNNQARINSTKDFELVLKCRKGKPYLTETIQSSFLPDCPAVPASETDHPYSKPFKVWDHLLSCFTQPTDTILDPFAGQFSFANSAIPSGTNTISIEQDEVFFRRGILGIVDQYRAFCGPDTTFTLPPAAENIVGRDPNEPAY